MVQNSLGGIPRAAIAGFGPPVPHRDGHCNHAIVIGVRMMFSLRSSFVAIDKAMAIAMLAGPMASPLGTTQWSLDMTTQWANDIEVSALTQKQQAAYDSYKKAYAVAKAAREAFEATMQDGVPAGSTLICNYRFGKLSVALVDAKTATAANGKPKQSLAEFLAQQKAQGR